MTLLPRDRREPPPRVALIDLGTNTALMTVLFADPRDRRRLRIAEDLQIITGLGRDRARDGSLSAAGRGRAKVALRHFAGRIEALGVPEAAVVGAATSAAREAPDGRDFLDAIADELGLRLHLISGEQEAEAVALAQERSFRARMPILMLDIGGGSTEFALRTRGRTDWAVSVPVGSVKFAERFGTDLKALDEAVSEALSGLPEVRGPATLVGVAGTATTSLQVARGMATWDPSEIHGQELGRDELAEVRARLAAMTPQERLGVPGLDPGRSELIVAGMSLLLGAMHRTGRNSCVVSDRGVRFGLLWQRWPLAAVV